MFNTSQKNLPQQSHPFHLVTPSPWPLYTSFSMFLLALGSAMYFHGYAGGVQCFERGLLLTILMATVWLRDVTHEAQAGFHTSFVQRGIKLGFGLFIVSEIMFFFGFFWAFFHSSLSPAIQIGAVWPPMGIIPFDPLGMPALNTLILLTSGAMLTSSHYAIIARQDKVALGSLIGTVVLGLAFTLCQFYEYSVAPFSINDSVYGSTFFMTTGFHGAHVALGIIFLAVTSFRFWLGQMTAAHHVGFEISAWYWHFVDVVWLFVYMFIYCWGN